LYYVNFLLSVQQLFSLGVGKVMVNEAVTDCSGGLLALSLLLVFWLSAIYGEWSCGSRCDFRPNYPAPFTPKSLNVWMLSKLHCWSITMLSILNV